MFGLPYPSVPRSSGVRSFFLRVLVGPLNKLRASFGTVLPFVDCLGRVAGKTPKTSSENTWPGCLGVFEQGAGEGRPPSFHF